MGKRMGRHSPYWWAGGALSIVSALLFVSAGLLQAGVAFRSAEVLADSQSSQAPTVATAPVPSAHLKSSYQACLGANWAVCDVYAPTSSNCEFVSIVTVGIFGPGCGYTEGQAAFNAFTTSVELTDAKNLIHLLGDSLNITAAGTANMNATVQELLTYFEGRAEALVPVFLSLPWNETTIDQIAIDSGLVPAIEGMATAFASQEYQDWNGTAHSWNNMFGPYGTWTGMPSSLEENYTYYDPSVQNRVAGAIATDATNLSVTNPWEIWTGATPAGFSDPTFFNLATNGTIVCANIGLLSVNSCPDYMVTDFQQNFSFIVPAVNQSNWNNATNIPNEQALHSISPFDLLKLTCVANCSDSLKWVETRNAFAFRNISALNPDITYNGVGLPYGGFVPATYTPAPDTMIPELALVSTQGTFAHILAWEPDNRFALCVHEGNASITGDCQSGKVLGQGTTTAIGTGAGSIVGGNNTLTRFASTFQSLVNDTTLVSEVYYDTLRAATSNGTIAIPATCSIPYPSAGFPTAVQPGNYKLTLADGLAAYWSYLVAAHSAVPFGNATIAGLTFCGIPALSLEFKWQASWGLRMNITASIFLTGLVNGTSTPVWPNGTADPGSSYFNPASWPIQHVSPTLLFPYEYQMNIPVGLVWPVPINDPLAAIEVNYSGNAYYGNSVFDPAWGIPSYLQLYGFGNYILISGSISSVPSGTGVTKGDAIDVTSCILNNVSQNPCVVQVNYFNNFTYGHVVGLNGSISPPNPITGGGGGGLGGPSCGFNSLNQFYDAWAGNIGSAVAGAFAHFGNAVGNIPIIGGGLASIINGLGCIIAWVIIILIFALFAYIAVKVVVSMYRGAKGSRSAKSDNVS